MTDKRKKQTFAIFIIAYNAIETIVEVYERIPDDIKKTAEEIYVIDDCSQDETYERILLYKKNHNLSKLTIIRNEKNLGYGGNQKKGYDYAIKKGYNLVIMLHADAQYAPEKIKTLLTPFDKKENVGMVFGSRMLEDPLKGGMPLHKYLGNKVLTAIQNTILGTSFSEFHSGYRCYSTLALSAIPYNKCSDGFSFDSEIMIMLIQHGYEIDEVPIPTYYGKEKCHVPLIAYGLNCIRAVVEYKLSQIGVMYFERYSQTKNITKINKYKLKSASYSSHTIINDIVKKQIDLNKGRKLHALDVGCGNGTLFKEIANKMIVDGIDMYQKTLIPHYHKIYIGEIDNFEQIKLLTIGTYDIIIFGDILEHCKNPDDILTFYLQYLNKGGIVIISVPNIANIFIRLSLLFGLFNYTEKGILDRTHLRFFTKKTLLSMIKRIGLSVDKNYFSIIPIELIIPGLVYLRKESFIRKLLYFISSIRPTLFGYQFIVEATKLNRKQT